MFQRQKREKDEGKSYNEPGVCNSNDPRTTNLIDSTLAQVSAEMKALNAKFGSLHGISSLANMSAVIALGFHGLWIGNVGLQGY
jgi:hypothetical protein